MNVIKRWLAGGALMGLLLAHAAASDATPLTLTDPYGQGPSDVIGTPAHFDIEKIVFTSLTSNLVTAEIYFDASASPGLSLIPSAPIGGYQYNYLGAFKLSVGDLLFDVGGTYKYGVALTDHDGLTAGNVYSLTGGSVYTSTDRMLAQGVPTNPSTYRINTPVQIGSSYLLDAVGSAPVVSPGGSTIYKVAVSFDPSNAFWTDLSTSGLSVHFASATCANDVIDGKVTEPGTLLLLGGGLVAMVVAGRKGLARK